MCLSLSLESKAREKREARKVMLLLPRKREKNECDFFRCSCCEVLFFFTLYFSLSTTTTSPRPRPPRAPRRAPTAPPGLDLDLLLSYIFLPLQDAHGPTPEPPARPSARTTVRAREEGVSLVALLLLLGRRGEGATAAAAAPSAPPLRPTQQQRERGTKKNKKKNGSDQRAKRGGA